jgi:lysylphosphatidylglycerol synthetase-like protein (DUF2156 family)
MNGDWIFVVLLAISFVLFIVAASLEHGSAAIINKYSTDDTKLQSASSLLEINLGLGLGIGISGLIFVFIAMILLAFASLILAVLGLFPVKMIGKILFGVILIALGVTAIILSSNASYQITTSDFYNSADIDQMAKYDIDLALSYNNIAFGLFIGLTVTLFVLFLAMAFYDHRKAKQNVENLVNESVETILKFSENVFKKVRSHYEGPKNAVDDELDVNTMETLVNTGIDNIVESIKNGKQKKMLEDSAKKIGAVAK